MLAAVESRLIYVLVDGAWTNEAPLLEDDDDDDDGAMAPFKTSGLDTLDNERSGAYLRSRWPYIVDASGADRLGGPFNFPLGWCSRGSTERARKFWQQQEIIRDAGM